MAGSAINETLMAQIQRQQQTNKQLLAHQQRKMRRQTERDVAAAYGKTMPFQAWEFQ